MIKTVIKLRNGEVMVFDASGEQMPEYQGGYEQVRDGILRDATSEVRFMHWPGYATEPQAVPKESW